MNEQNELTYVHKLFV